MKKEELKALIDEHLELRKKTETLQEELKKLDDRYDKVGELLYGFRSKEFLRSLLSFLIDIRAGYDKDQHFEDLLESIIHALKHHDHIEERKNFTPKHLLKLYDEKIE